MTKYALSLYLLVGALLSGCVALHTFPSPEIAESSTEPRVGNYYFLPRGIIQLDGSPVSKDFQTEFQVTIKTQNVPDRYHRFFLRHEQNVFYEDDLQIKVNGKGLLETTSLSTEDKTPAVISKVASTLIDAAQIAAAGPVTPFRNASEAAAGITLKPFHVIFDPFDPTQRAAAKQKLADCGFDLRFPNPARAIARMVDSKDRMSAKRISNSSTVEIQRLTDLNGVLYHPPTAIELEISTLDDSETGLLQHVWVRLPSPTEVAVADTSRAFLIKKKNNYGFVDGDLVQIDYNKPSQALAFVSVPADIVHQVAAAIPTIIGIEDKRAARMSPDLVAQKTQLDAETALLNSRISLLEAQQRLEHAQGTGSPNRPLTREALMNQAKAEEDEAEARADKAAAEKAEARSRAARAREQTGAPSVTPAPTEKPN